MIYKCAPSVSFWAILLHSVRIWRCLCDYVGMKRQVWSTRSARNFADSARTKDGGTTHDSDVTSGALQTSRAQKQRQLTGTENDIMQQMLYPAAKQPPLSSQLNEHKPTPEHLNTETKQVAASRAERKRAPTSRGKAEDVTVSDVKTRESTAGSDDESIASADTYTIDSDGKEELRKERARIDAAFGIVSDSTPDDRQPPSTDNDDTQLLDAEVADEDKDIDECSPKIHDDSDEGDQPRLKRTKNQTLFTEFADDNASSGAASKSDSPLDLVCSENANHDVNELDRDSSVSPDQGADEPELTSSQSNVKRLPSGFDGIAVDDNAFARQNSVSNAAGDKHAVAVDVECKEPELVQSSKADASFGRDEDDDDDDHHDGDGNDRSLPADITPLETTERFHEVTRNVLDCDQSNYSSRIIFSYRPTFTLGPNTNRIR